jgi:hypothetical protein
MKIDAGAMRPHAPLEGENGCENLDQIVALSVYGVLEDFNEKAEADFTILVGSDNQYSPAASIVPENIDARIAKTYRFEHKTLEEMIRQAKESGQESNGQHCSMRHATKVADIFRNIVEFYEGLVAKREMNRREGIITPEMLHRHEPRFST